MLELTRLPVFGLFVFFLAQAAVEQPCLTNYSDKLHRSPSSFKLLKLCGALRLFCKETKKKQVVSVGGANTWLWGLLTLQSNFVWKVEQA